MAHVCMYCMCVSYEPYSPESINIRLPSDNQSTIIVGQDGNVPGMFQHVMSDISCV